MADMALLFRISGTTLGLDASSVARISALPAITFMPRMPKCVKGVASIREGIVPVIDLAELTGVQASAYRCAILVETPKASFAIMADDVVSTVRYEPQAITREDGKLFYAFLPDATAMIDPDFLVKTILQSAEGVV